MNDKICIQTYQSPYGEMILGSYLDRLCLCDWAVSRKHQAVLSRVTKGLDTACHDRSSAVINRAMKELDAYFCGRQQTFSIPTLTVGTDFQKRVWEELMNIPYGTVITYSEQARRMGTPNAVRAVAAANGLNALSIIIPCHRVVGSDGSLTGYAGGMETKQSLILLERSILIHRP